MLAPISVLLGSVLLGPKGSRLMLKASRLRVFLLLLASIAITAPTAFGYAGETAVTVTVTGPTGALQCGTGYTLSATVIGASGTPVPNKGVNWSIQSGPAGATDTIAPVSSTTNSSGVAQTTVTFGGVIGPRTIRATADNAFG